MNQQEYLEELKQLAETNAFDVSTTLNAIEAAIEVGLSSSEKYELLRLNLEVNDRSAELWKAYILACAEDNLRAFGETAFEKLAELSNSSELAEVRAEFERILNDKQASIVR